jgi:hypothetical protein
MLLAPTLSLSAGSGAAIARPTFSRDFAGEKTLNNGTGPAITFTRASNATFFDANGELRFAPHNVFRNSEAAGATVGVIGSGGVLPTNWMVNAVTGVSREVVGVGTVDGLNYVDIRFYGTRSGGSSVTINISAEPTMQIAATAGQTWTGSMSVAVVGGSLTNISNLTLTLSGRASAGSAVTGENPSTAITDGLTLTRYSVTRRFESQSVTAALNWLIGTVADGATIDVTFRIAAPQMEQNTTASEYVPTTGAAKFDQPRFDHSGGSSLGLLIEEARTNSLPNSQMAGAAAGSAGTAPTGWSITGPTAGLTRTIATGTVNGMAYIDVSYAGTVSNGGSVLQLLFDPQSSTAGYAASSGQSWTASVYLALTSGEIPAGASFDVYVRERNASHAVLASSSVNPSLASSLQRFSVTRTFNNAATVRVTLDVRMINIPDGATVDFTLRIAAPQLEQGAFPTSYIPTTAAAATRAADSAIVTPISSFYNATESTLYAELQSLSPLTPAQSVALSRYPYVFNFSQTGASSNIFWYGTAAELYLSTVFNNLGSVVVGGINKIAVGMAASGGQSASSLNGAAAANRSGANTPAPTFLGLGSDGNAGSGTFLNGHIRKIAYWPKRLTNTLLQQLTT